MEKNTAIEMIKGDFALFDQDLSDISKSVKNMAQDAKDYIHALILQIQKTSSGPPLAKTPKLTKKRTTRIKAIPENEEMETDLMSFTNSISNSSEIDNMVLEVTEVPTGRVRRGASIKAADNIKKQQSITLSSKLRRPSNSSDESLLSKIAKDNTKSKRPKESVGSSDDDSRRPSKQSKIDNSKSVSATNAKNKQLETTDDSVSLDNQTVTLSKTIRQSLKRKLENQDDEVNATLTLESVQQNVLLNNEPAAKKAYYSKSPLQKKKNTKYVNKLETVGEKLNSPEQKQQRTTRSSSLITAQSTQRNKTKNVINETADMSNADETLASMYEDALGKPLPIMNSTMNPNSTVTLEKMMNVTVSIEPLSSKKILNETVTIKKNYFKEPVSYGKSCTSKDMLEDKNAESNIAGPSNVKRSSRNRKNSDIQGKRNVPDKFNEFITDDESSPERKKPETLNLPQKKRVTRSNNSLISDDEIPRTPVTLTKNKEFKLPTVKSSYKPAALFSPYAKDSVKKRVEAFEQVAVSPKKADGEMTVRVTRTKTRALAAATETPKDVTIKLARKSLAKAKKISLAKGAKDYDDTKENENLNTIKSKKKTSSIEKSSKKSQSKTTPLGKSRLAVPSSANKNQFATPSNAQSLSSYSKPLTASRGNIVTHVDSFIQPMKSASKPIDKMVEEKRKRVYDEDVRRKKEELLKAQADEKRRKREEKELKNKLAREAKEKLEMEKRLKAEKEREEKAKIAQLVQEKQKEEMEKKRIAHLQRAQEKEEKRKQEELLRMQRLQEQEEQERMLAEQKRREQELEKRKLAEIRHQMAAELKMKQQLDKAAQQSKAKAAATSQKQTTYNYKIDSDPDEDDTDDECKPKHQIPPWALKQVRQPQLAMQQYIPMKSILRFFDVKKCTPDLRELFKGIDPKKLKRSSSAIWKTPPRFSMMDRSVIKD